MTNHEAVCSHGFCLECLKMKNTWSIKFKWMEICGYQDKRFNRVLEFVGGDTPIFILKCSIANVIDDEINPEDVVLTYRSIELSDNEKTLADYKIPSGFIVMDVRHSVTDYFETA